MNKTAIKNFAIWARNKLIADIVYQAGLLGVTDKGIAQPLPQSTGEVQFFDIGTKDYMTVRGKAIRQRNAFVAAIKVKQADTDYASAFRFVVEKVAYTWFNRLIAIRFMEVNDYLPGRVRVLSSENPGKAEPDMVTRPFDTDMSFSAQEQDEIMRMKDENKLDELFRMLFIKQCQKLHEVLPGLFDPQGIERVDSYLELLLTISFTDKDGVLWHLVHDIDEDDFNVEKEGQVEIIGWMYQYYNTEPKDQVFANLKKNIKINKDNIPAATQLFTPDWIVRYMVENSLGRLWLEGHPNEELKKSWKYYLEEAEQEPQVQAQLAEIRKEYAALRPEEIKVIDPCMGSGHILVYLFDVLMQIYESQGWTQREAAQSIVQNNLYGLDIDDRAAQLTYFAVMMKARQYDRRFLEREIMPHIHGIQESNAINRGQIQLFGKDMSSLEKNSAMNQLNEMLDAFQDAKEYGSIINMPYLDLDLLNRYLDGFDDIKQITLDTVGVEETLIAIKSLVDQAHALTQKYDALVTNPPYMGGNGMSPKLSEYVKDYYPEVKYDLFSCFIQRGINMLKPFGMMGEITMESWMFLSSFEKLRSMIIHEKTIQNMVHMPYLGRGGTSLGINFGTSAFIIANYHVCDYLAQYVYVRYYETDDEGIPKEFPVINERYKATSLESMMTIPGQSIAYWTSKELLSAFVNGKKLKEDGDTRQGMATSDNNRFLRLWYEVDLDNIAFSCRSSMDAKESGKKWFPYNKGGAYRKWYGNEDYIINYKNDGQEVKEYAASLYKSPSRTIKSMSEYFKPCLSWSKVTTVDIAFRYYPAGFVFDVAGCCIFYKSQKEMLYHFGFLNSSVCGVILKMISPTMNYEAGHIASLPIIYSNNEAAEIERLVIENIGLSKEDWDSNETSWGFKRHPLIGEYKKLEDAYAHYKKDCLERFNRLKENEESINKAFIRIYGLASELTPNVETGNITVVTPNISNSVRSLISYAVGCMFGRFSLDTDSIAYAGGEWDDSRYKTFMPDSDNCIPITDEPYFDDDIVGRFIEFIRIVYGQDSLEDNLNFIANALGVKGNSSRETLRSYFLNDFYKEHCSTYSVSGSGKRPIYWLFDSGKQNGFNALVYMHRWNADTVGNLRVEYLHRMQHVYEKEIERMQDIIDNSRDNREVNQASKRREKLVKQLKEARDYDAKIAHVALSRVEIDLDDGVKVNYEKVQQGPDGKSLGILAKI